MLGLVGQLLPIGLAAAISTVPITAMLLILLSPRRSVAAVPFLVGYVLGTFFAVGLALLLAQALPEGRPRQPQPVTGIVEILIGSGLIVLGIHGWRKRHRSSGPAPTPRWATAIDALSPGRAFVLGFLIDLRPKSLLLAAVVGLQLHGDTGR
ncbi:MAG TPA: GAP family protein, partial [Microlunatus sp.]|nr:GAP family protein [Microlunatus sp.]